MLWVDLLDQIVATPDVLTFQIGFIMTLKFSSISGLLFEYLRWAELFLVQN